MKRFIIKLVIFCVFIIGLDFAVGAFGKTVMKILGEGNYSGKVSMMNYNINYAAPEIAILGSSSALSAYIPSIIQDSLRLDVGRVIDIRNVSCYVQGLPYFKAELKTLIGRQKPEMVVLDMTPHYLSNFQDIIGVLRPYYHTNAEIKKMFDSRISRWERIKMQSNMYCLNSTIASLLASFKNPKGCDGYWPNYDHLRTIPHSLKTEEEVDSTNLDIFKDIIRISKDENIHLIVSYSPTNVKYTEGCETYSVLREVCESNEIPFFDFTADHTFDNDELFADGDHLRDPGAKVFTSYFYSSVKEELIQTIN